MSFATGGKPARAPGFLDRERIIAPPGYNRWLVPPSALAIHLCIGQVYAFSVFNFPLNHLIGIWAEAEQDWKLTEIGWIFSTAIVCLGLSAAVFGQWLERAGPRKAMFASAACFGGGFLVSAAGVALHQIWLLYVGYGVLGGIGLGLGYISPVSTLIKWFPDRPGLATGLAIMGFGGGAMIGAPLANWLLHHFRSASSAGVVETFVTMGCLYFTFMTFGALTVRVPPPGWTPGQRTPGRPARPTRSEYVTADDAIRTPQFWLLWAVLLLNVTAGIGVLNQASPMIQEMFPGRVNEAVAAGFVGLLSLFNMAGRIGWSSLSDVIGRKTTYAIFFSLGALLYALVPMTGHLGSIALFVAANAVILSMYGGGFATIPAYLRDMFGTGQVGAIHGRLLTAWSCAGVAGPALVNYIRDYQLQHNVPKGDVYDITMYLMAGLLAIGFVCNLLVRPVDREFFTAEPTTPPAPDGSPAVSEVTLPAEKPAEASETAGSGQTATLLFRWTWVLIPLGWGVWQTGRKSLELFR